jgi:predicted GH43/DUF377 family glycosyl hydrolase
MELFTRYDANPILEASGWPGEVNSVFNPAAVEVEGETILLVRVEDRTGISHLGVARSADGLSGWTIEPERALLPDLGSEEERFGIEDPRVTRVGEEWFILFTGYSVGGPLVMVATTRDFRSYERRGVVLPPRDKDAALFPDRVGGRYHLLHRPMAGLDGEGAGIEIASSADLHNWDEHGLVLRPGEDGSWASHKIGVGPPPLLTADGWLVLYHGVRLTASGSIYRAGLALLDRDRPARVIARSPEWAFGPQAPYERVGDVGNVVFPCGWIVGDDGDTLRVYYGAADTCVCVATASLAALLDHLR